MSDWKNDYLAEAGVPRWVRRDLPVEAASSVVNSEAVSAQVETKEVVESAVAEQPQTLQKQSLVTVLIEHSNPQFIIVLPKNSELLLVKPLWSQLQKAWKAWAGTEFAASCYRLDSNGLVDLDEVVDASSQTLRKTVLAGVQASIDNSIQAENLTFDSAINKRQWWTTLQTLLKSVRH